MRRYRQRGEGTEGFERPADMAPALYRLLVRRGIRSAEEAERFLHPGVEDLNEPFLLSGMTEAVQMIRESLEAGEHIAVYGDYDVDGVCASSILSEYLISEGAAVEVYLPSRHTEGYGLNESAIRQLAKRCGLMVTVDCGVTSVELVALAKSLGMKVVVTDHHRPAEVLPDCPVINPLLNNYPFGFLCGAGVAFQLVAALGGRGAAMKYVDLAAMATVADVVPLVSENRAIVRMGLDVINTSPRPGIQALINVAGLEDRDITADNIAFQLAPRLNAGGRVGSARRPQELLVEKSETRAKEIALELDEENSERRSLEQQILDEALKKLENFDFPAHRAIVLAGEGWNPGVIGLAASRLVEQFHYPAILMASDGETCVGSCRSIEGVDIHAALTAVQEHLVRFGGHKQAAGLTILAEKVPAFAAALDDYLFENIPAETYVPSEDYDLEVAFSELGDVFVESLEAIQPTGMGNPAPVFRACAEVREARAVGRDGAHLKLRLMQENTLLDAIRFREGNRAGECVGEQDLLFTPKINSYMGRTSVQLELKALNPRDNLTRIYANIQNEPRLIRRFLTDILYNRHYPDNLKKAEVQDVNVLRESLKDSVQGTLIVADDFEAAKRIIYTLDGVTLDLTVGVYPDDPRAFNAIAVCPAGKIPAGYRCCISAGSVPDAGSVEHLNADLLRGAWRDELPDVDELRELYKALRRMLARPLYSRTLENIENALSEEAGCSGIKALAGLFALHDMRLADLVIDGERAEIKILPMQKKDPMTSGVFRRICALKNSEN